MGISPFILSPIILAPLVPSPAISTNHNSPTYHAFTGHLHPKGCLSLKEKYTSLLFSLSRTSCCCVYKRAGSVGETQSSGEDMRDSLGPLSIVCIRMILRGLQEQQSNLANCPLSILLNKLPHHSTLRGQNMPFINLITKTQSLRARPKSLPRGRQ
jgi:hypothetical protein